MRVEVRAALTAAILLASIACVSAPRSPTNVGSAAETPAADGALAPPDFLRESEPRASILLLGTFHFADAGLDGYKPKFHVDIRSPERQAEVEEVARLIAAYRPTKVAVEWPPQHQQRTDSLYRAYLRDDFELGSNEVYQLGFRIARMLGHERVYLVDAPGLSYFPDLTEEQYAARNAELRDRVRPGPDWNARYTQLYAWGDSMKTETTLREFLTFMNSPARVRQSHGHYVVGHFHLHEDGDWWGPDLSTRWYNRNLRIFANLQRITESEQERILFVVGAGHLPILRFVIDASPEYQLVEASDYLAPTTTAGRSLR